MRFSSALPPLCGLLASATLALAAGSTGSPFYGDPPDDRHPWAIHDQNRPQPPLVTPGTPSTQQQPGKPPSDAIILFDGTADSLKANWEADKNPAEPTKWIVNDGAMECVPKSGYIRTKQQFGDCQLHVEWAAPTKVEGDSQGRGNSGIFLMGVECQVLDNYNNPTYADGFACSVYSVNPPLANALRPPGEFQSIDILFRRPVYKEDKCLDPGYITVFCNGVCVQDHTQLEGGTSHMRRSKPGPMPEKGPLKFQDHGNPVRFRNVWYRPLPPRAVEGGTDGPLTPEATMAKRKEIAATIRQDAAKLKGDPTAQMLRLMESIVYEKDEATLKQADDMATRYVEALKAVPADQLNAKKDEAKRVNAAMQYLAKFNIATLSAKPELEKLIKAQGWDKR